MSLQSRVVGRNDWAGSRRAVLFLQRSKLAWLYEQITYAVTLESQKLPVPKDTSTIAQGLAIGNTWSLWNCYKAGHGWLAVTALEGVLALYFAERSLSQTFGTWVAATLPFAAGISFDACLWIVTSSLDQRDAAENGG